MSSWFDDKNSILDIYMVVPPCLCSLKAKTVFE